MQEKGDYKSKELEFPTCDYSLILELMTAYYHFPTLIVANDLGLFPFLADGPKTEEVIREHLGLGERASEAMLGILAALGFLLKRQGAFYLTEVSRNYLLPGKPFYWGVCFPCFGTLL